MLKYQFLHNNALWNYIIFINLSSYLTLPMHKATATTATTAAATTPFASAIAPPKPAHAQQFPKPPSSGKRRNRCQQL
jgi:hypothetical protein